MNEDVILPRKDKDGELLSAIPKDIYEVGDYIRDKQEKMNKELFKQLEKDKEIINKLK